MDTYVEPRLRTVRLRAAVAVGVAAVVGAFGVGYAVAQSFDRPVRATAVEPSFAAGDAFSDAVAESLALKRYQRGK